MTGDLTIINSSHNVTQLTVGGTSGTRGAISSIDGVGHGAVFYTGENPLSGNVFLQARKSGRIAVESEINALVNYYGSKNLFPDFIDSQVYKGITWTRNADTSITVSGTAQGWSTLSYSSIPLKSGTYKISSGIADSGNAYNVYAEIGYVIDETNYNHNTSYGDKEFTITSDVNATVQIVVRTNVAISGTVTIYPMIRASIIDNSDFVPYAMTNRELTQVASQSYEIFGNMLYLHRIGKMRFLGGPPVVADSVASITLPEYDRPPFISMGTVVFWDNHEKYITSGYVLLKTDGTFEFGLSANYNDNSGFTKTPTIANRWCTFNLIWRTA